MESAMPALQAAHGCSQVATCKPFVCALPCFLKGCTALPIRLHSDREWLCSRLPHGAACPGQLACAAYLPRLLCAVAGTLSSCHCSSAAAASCMLQQQHCMAWTGIQQGWPAHNISATRHVSSQMLLQCHDDSLLLQVLRRSGTPKEQAYAKRLERVSAESCMCVAASS